MKKYLFMFCLIGFLFVPAFAQEDALQYCKSKTEISGELCPIYWVKDEKTFDTIFLSLIKESFGFNKYELPEIAKIKNTFVSEDYLKESYPNFALAFIGLDRIIELEFKEQHYWPEGEYHILCDILNDDLYNVTVLYHYNHKQYVNYLLYSKESEVWIYTKKALEIMNLNQ